MESVASALIQMPNEEDYAGYAEWLDEIHAPDAFTQWKAECQEAEGHAQWVAECEAAFNHDYNETAKELSGGVYR